MFILRINILSPNTTPPPILLLPVRAVALRCPHLAPLGAH